MTPPARRDAETLAVVAFLDSCRSMNTRSAYRSDLGHLAAWCHEHGSLELLGLTTEDLARYRAACEGSGASSGTVARRLSAVSSFSTFARGGEAASLAMPQRTVRPSRPTIDAHTTTELLDDDDARALLDAADGLSDRTSSVIRLLMLDGLKVGELTRTNVGDVAFARRSAQLEIRDARHARRLELHATTVNRLRRYVGVRRRGPLVRSEQRGNETQRISRFGVDFIIKQTAVSAGLTQSISANVLRRRYVVAAHARGSDLEAIRYRVGHQQSRTTRRYLDSDVEPD